MLRIRKKFLREIINVYLYNDFDIVGKVLFTEIPSCMITYDVAKYILILCNKLMNFNLKIIIALILEWH